MVLFCPSIPKGNKNDITQTFAIDWKDVMIGHSLILKINFLVVVTPFRKSIRER